MKAQKLEVVSMIKIGGVWVRQDELPREQLREILEKKLDTAMKHIGFDRIPAA